MRILLADDDNRVRAALHLMIDCHADWSVVGESTDAESLLVQAQELRPDLVLLDWELPGQSRITLTHSLRALGCGTKVIALSTKQESREDALSAGSDAFVSKADPPEHLLATLHGFAKAM